MALSDTISFISVCVSVSLHSLLCTCILHMAASSATPLRMRNGMQQNEISLCLSMVEFILVTLSILLFLFFRFFFIFSSFSLVEKLLPRVLPLLFAFPLLIIFHVYSDYYHFPGLL